jgi:flagellar FliJ protein
MQRFHFRLDSVLRYRKYLERTAQIRLGIAEQAFINCREKIDSLKRLRKTVSDKLECEGQKGMRVHAYQIYKLYIEKIDSDITFEQQRLQELIVSRERKREELKSTSIKKKSLARLKDIEYTRNKEYSTLLEQKAIDELILLRRKVTNS